MTSQSYWDAFSGRKSPSVPPEPMQHYADTVFFQITRYGDMFYEFLNKINNSAHKSGESERQ